MSEESVFEKLLENMEQTFFILESVHDENFRVYLESVLRDVYDNIQCHMAVIPGTIPYV
tara:strand:- start:292 stop:468 length:177 start_codon:yes stop_codon:yes gene_type:complete